MAKQNPPEYGHYVDTDEGDSSVRAGSYDQGRHQPAGQRSDERIRELLSERLREDPEIDPSDVTIDVQGGRITLEGTVDSSRVNEAIEDAAQQFGVGDVQNRLRVQRGDQ